jgi:hypothetical protein
MDNFGREILTIPYPEEAGASIQASQETVRDSFAGWQAPRE